MINRKLTKSEYKIIFLASLGGALEFYDFIIYIFFANELSQLFFPRHNHFASLMGVFAIFAIGYLIRPLGGMIFSHYGDKVSRKQTFVITLILMAVPTFLIGTLPTVEQIGILATGFLLILRVLQGLSVGGEIPGAIIFAGEHVPAQFRGLTCAIIFFGLNSGIVLGSLVSLIINTVFTPTQVLQFGWRIPFLLGGILGILSFYLRKQMSETPIFAQFKKNNNETKAPLLIVLKDYRISLLKGIVLTWLGAVIITLCFLYMPTYLTKVLNYPKNRIDILNTANLLFFSSFGLVLGFLSDYFGRKIFLIIGTIGLMLMGNYLFQLIILEQLPYLMTAMIGFSLLGCCIISIFPTVLLELFPTHVRYTGYALSYNIGFGIFGGLTPLIATYLIKLSGQTIAPAWYLVLSAVVGLIISLFLKNKHGVALSAIS